MITKPSRNDTRKRRHKVVRKKVYGTAERPRLGVFRSLNNIYAQIINDDEGATLVSASTLDKELKEGLEHAGNKEAAKKLGEIIAQRAKEAGIEEVVFDRSGYIYHGRIKEFAESAREAGLKF